MSRQREVHPAHKECVTNNTQVMLLIKLLRRTQRPQPTAPHLSQNNDWLMIQSFTSGAVLKSDLFGPAYIYLYVHCGVTASMIIEISIPFREDNQIKPNQNNYARWTISIRSGTPTEHFPLYMWQWQNDVERDCEIQICSQYIRNL